MSDKNIFNRGNLKDIIETVEYAPQYSDNGTRNDWGSVWCHCVVPDMVCHKNSDLLTNAAIPYVAICNYLNMCFPDADTIRPSNFETLETILWAVCMECCMEAYDAEFMDGMLAKELYTCATRIQKQWGTEEEEDDNEEREETVDPEND